MEFQLQICYIVTITTAKVVWKHYEKKNNYMYLSPTNIEYYNNQYALAIPNIIFLAF